MEVKMTITTHFGGDPKFFVFNKKINSLDELKTAFLKRFGNMHDESNKLLKQKDLVKKLTREAKSLAEWLQNVNTKTDWHLSVLFLDGEGF